MSEVSRRSFLVGGSGLLVAACASPRRKVAPTSWPAFEVERFVDDVKQTCRRGEGQAAVDELLARAVADPAQLLRVLGEPKEGLIRGLNMDEDEDCTILYAVLPQHAVIQPHDHHMWASIGVYTGREDNMMWRRTDAGIEAVGARSVGAKETFGLPSDAIHSLVNPARICTAGIHVYGGNLSQPKRSQWDPATLREEPFDLEDARRILGLANRRAKVV